MAKGAQVSKRSFQRAFMKNLLIFAFVIVSSTASFFAGEFFLYSHAFSLAVKTGNDTAAQSALSDLRNLYGRTRHWHAERLADILLFRRMNVNEGAYFYLTRRYGEAERSLSGEEGYLVDHILGVAKFREAQIMYKAGKKQEALALVRGAMSNFKLSVENGPDAYFNDRWNYDLMVQIADSEPDKSNNHGELKEKNPLDGGPKGLTIIGPPPPKLRGEGDKKREQGPGGDKKKKELARGEKNSNGKKYNEEKKGDKSGTLKKRG